MVMMIDMDRRQGIRAQVAAALLALGSLIGALLANMLGVELACDVVIAVWAMYLIVFIINRTADLRSLDLVDDRRLHDLDN